MGRVLYPRFFSKNDGLASTNPWPAYAFHDYPRIGFLLLNQTNISVVFPTKKIAQFPHAADAIILGCQRDGYVEARWVAFPELDTVYSSDPLHGNLFPLKMNRLSSKLLTWYNLNKRTLPGAGIFLRMQYGSLRSCCNRHAWKQ